MCRYVLTMKDGQDDIERKNVHKLFNFVFFEENFASYASTFFATLPWPGKKANELDSFFVCSPEMGCQRAVPE